MTATADESVAPRVSVIVPVFNVEEYVARCIDSLLRQDLKDIEIVVVNDGSSDGTGRIVERYAREHGNVRLLNQPNSGLSAARNAGMSIASGSYLGFVDGDDWVDGSMYSSMLDRAEVSGADLVIANGQLYNHETGELRPVQDFRIWRELRRATPGLEFSPRSSPELFILDTSACKRLYRRSFLESIEFEFPAGKIFEDVPTHYRLLLKARKVALVDTPLYFYRTHRPGRITAREDRSLFQVFEVLDQVIDDLNRESADDAIWASFIWFQNWVMRWLRKQIDPALAIEFDSKCMAVARAFTPAALQVFHEKFRDDRKAVEFVLEQTGGTLTCSDGGRS